MKMLEERIEDKQFLRLIRKWLKAVVLDTNGQVLHPATGTPQGGDLWFHRVVRPRCCGEACLIRYADDLRFHRELGQWLGKFGLELLAAKTQVISFSQHGDLASWGDRRRGWQLWRPRAGMRKRVSRKSPVRENCTPGSVQGRLGNWPSYRDTSPLTPSLYRVK